MKGKYYLVDFLKDKTKISNVEIVALEKGLRELAEETDVKFLPYYQPISRQQLLNDISELAEALEPLEKRAITLLISLKKWKYHSTWN